MNLLRLLKPHTIREKLLTGLTALIVLIALFIFLYFPFVLEKPALASNVDEVRNIADMAAVSIAPALNGNSRAKSNVEEVLKRIQQNRELLYYVLKDRAGKVVHSYNPEEIEGLRDYDWAENPHIPPGSKKIHIMKPFAQDGKEVGRLFMGFSLADLEGHIKEIRRTTAWVSFAVLVVGMLVAFSLSTLITAPMKHLSETASQIARGDLTRRAKINRDDEIGHLSRWFNTMVNKLESTRSDLQDLNMSLEQRVSDRTQALQKEINDRKTVEKELMLEKERAEAANRAKSEFLASMSHELRTPLNAVIGFAQVLADKYFGDLNSKQTEYIKDIQTSGEHLLGLINDILDIAKIEAGKMEMDYSPIQLRELLEHSFIMIKEKCARHKIRLYLQLDPSVDGLEMMADIRKLKQILYNLLSNSSKFTPDGGTISIEAERKQAKVVISVADTGIGIEPDHQEKIFEEFYQVKGGTLDKTPGTGLGLALSRRIVELHGGRIWVESQGQGMGSRFNFEIPILEVPPHKKRRM